ncbi:MAG TPA: hypothetical protein GX511_07765, partial [Firmicutes bacterium]|nr:hypothetical protein [Bacillota bacterium]
DEVVVRFQKPVRAIAPGQAAVFYRGEEVLGGGVIKKAGTVSESKGTPE